MLILKLNYLKLRLILNSSENDFYLIIWLMVMPSRLWVSTLFFLVELLPGLDLRKWYFLFPDAVIDIIFLRIIIDHFREERLDVASHRPLRSIYLLCWLGGFDLRRWPHIIVVARHRDRIITLLVLRCRLLNSLIKLSYFLRSSLFGVLGSSHLFLVILRSKLNCSI